MRDGLMKCGNLSLATDDTRVYSADYIDLGDIDSDSRFTLNTLPEDLYICFRNTSAFDSIDSFIPEFQTADDSSFSVNAEVTSFPQTAAELAAGTIHRYRVPANVRRYIRAAATPKSTSTFTAETVEAWFEEGAQQQTL